MKNKLCVLEHEIIFKAKMQFFTEGNKDSLKHPLG